METTSEGKVAVLYGREIAELNPTLVPVEDFAGKRIVSVQTVEGYRASGNISGPRAGTPWGVVIRFDDGTASEVVGALATHSFAQCPVEGLLQSGLVSPAQVEKIEAKLAAERQLTAEIASLLDQRCELLHQLDKRLRFGLYRGLVKQVRGIEARLESLGYKFEK